METSSKAARTEGLQSPTMGKPHLHTDESLQSADKKPLRMAEALLL